MACAFLAVALVAGTLHAGAATVTEQLAAALRGTQASAVVLDWRTGATLGHEGRAIRATPGSAIKPLLLAYALEHHIVSPGMHVYCRRDLRIGGRSLPCTHPADDPVFDAERALAESCNTWFAEMAHRFPGEELDAALGAANLPHRDARTANLEQRQLMVLGLQGVSASPLELARAYRGVLVHLGEDAVVMRGLKGSVSFGMAHPAAVPGMSILGKTGTSSNPGEAWTHGWFAGGLEGRIVLVIYVPHGDGGDAARVAHAFFQRVRQGTGTR
jgi:cell division protein FtsI/penicillin-binding protein 2